MRILTPAKSLLVVLTGFLAACGNGAATGAPGPASPAPRALAIASPASSAPAAVVTSSPSVSGAAGAVPIVAPPPPGTAPVVPSPMPIAHATSATFPLLAVGDRGARGSVSVTVQSGRAVITVLATGLPAGSAHSVHLHFGNCPTAGTHLLVLGMLRADPSGSGSVSVNVNAVFTGAGHFVIVYLGPSAGILGACANLG